MSEIQDPGLPESIDPKKLIVQAGEDEGRVADIELAQVGAEAENEPLDKEHKLKVALGGKNLEEAPFSYADLSEDIKEGAAVKGENAMIREVADRAEGMVPRASEDLKTKLGNAAGKRIRGEFENHDNRSSERDNAKAEAMIDQLSETE